MSFNQLQLPKASLDAAAKAVSDFLSDKGHRHAFIGGYAVSCLGESRCTHNVDIIVDFDSSNIKDALLKSRINFYMSQSNKLVYMLGSDPNDKTDVIVRVYRGGQSGELKLPDACPERVIQVHNNDIYVPIIRPSVLVLTKVKKWMFISESTRPASVTKATNDLEDIQVILQWLKKRSLQINFADYQEKPKEEILPGFRMLYMRDSEFKVLLNATMMEEDLASIRS